MTDTTTPAPEPRKFAVGQTIIVKTPGRYSKIVEGAVTRGDTDYIYYLNADGVEKKTRRGAIQ